MKKDRFKMIASGYLMLVRGGKILLSRRFQTGYEDGNYSLPAGHIEDNETLTDGTCREVKEETGIILRPSDLRLVHVMHRKHIDIRMDFFFMATLSRYTPKNLEPEKCDDLRWFPLTRLPVNTIAYIRAAVQCYRKKNVYSEFGWEGSGQERLQPPGSAGICQKFNNLKPRDARYDCHADEEEIPCAQRYDVEQA